MKKIFSLLIIFLLITTSFSSCQNESLLLRQQKEKEWFKSNDKIKVLATTAIVADLVKAIGRDHIDVLTLIPEELDPHSYQLVKGDDEKFSFAHLIFYNGLGLEHGQSLEAYLQKNSAATSLGDYIYASYPELVLFENHIPDPHIWMDLKLWAYSIPKVVAVLSHYDPLHASSYKSNGELFFAELNKADQRIKEILNKVPDSKRYLVTTHDAFNYFARAYLAGDNDAIRWQERFLAPEGLAPESQISGHEIRSVINFLKKHDVSVIFPESNVSAASLRKIIDTSKELGLSVGLAETPLYSDALGPKNSDANTHIGMIEHNAKTIASVLSFYLK